MTTPQPRRRPYSRHGITRLKAAVRRLGPRVIDRRTTLGKALAQWRAELIQDLGGQDAVSTQRAALVDLAVRSKLILDSLDTWLLVQPSLVNKRIRSVLPIVRERQALADGLARYLQALGLDRVERPPVDLGAYLAQRHGAPDSLPLDPSPHQEGDRDEPPTVKPPTLTPTDPTTAAAADAAQIVLGLVERLAPIHDRPVFRARLHEAAQTLQRALDAGASMDGVLAHLITATAPPAPVPAFESWTLVLELDFAEFAECGAALHVMLPALGEGIWLASDEATRQAVVQETRLWDRYIKLVPWMTLEADRLRLPAAERTVGAFITALDGKVIGWRAPEGR